MAEFLLEIGTEEIPARMLRKAANDLKQAITALLTEASLSFDPLTACYAPRQLVIYSYKVDVRQADRESTITGPPVRIAYDADGQPTKALSGFLRKNPEIDASQLERISQKKGEVVGARVFIRGRHTKDILAEALPGIFAGLHFAKNMRWGSESTRFVRPVRNLLALFDSEEIPFSFAGMTASATSFGHRVDGQSPIAVQNIDQYLSEKRNQAIYPSHEERYREIKAQIDTHLKSVGGHLVPDEPLLREVADLVEVPHVVLGSFDPQFLEIPREVLITAMREHQKSFALCDADGALMPHFMAIASMREDRAGLIKKGNEWVLNARLWDAHFFWHADLKKDFEALHEKLKDLIFQSELGSYHQKSARMAQLSNRMAAALNWSEEDKIALQKATRYAKADLVSDLVFEFAELQGTAGGLLLEAQGQPALIYQAVAEHYLPMGQDGDVPRTTAGALISIADKLDTLTGCFAIGLIPTGSKDPYALRRAAQGIVAVLIACELPFDLNTLSQWAMDTYGPQVKDREALGSELNTFFHGRMRHYLKRAGFEHDLANAVLAHGSSFALETVRRANAIREQQSQPYFRSLALNLKRMNNVIADELDQLPAFRESLLQEPAETALWQAFCQIEPDVSAAAKNGRYAEAMEAMTPLAQPVEAYFGTGGVYINVEEAELRRNRKAMIQRIRLTLGIVADISCLAPKI